MNINSCSRLLKLATVPRNYVGKQSSDDDPMMIPYQNESIAGSNII